MANKLRRGVTILSDVYSRRLRNHGDFSFDDEGTLHHPLGEVVERLTRLFDDELNDPTTLIATVRASRLQRYARAKRKS